MITVVFPNGHERVYKRANEVTPNGIIYRDEEGNEELIAKVPKNCIIEFEQADAIWKYDKLKHDSDLKSISK